MRQSALWHAQPKQVVLAGGRNAARDFVRAVHSRFLPNKVVVMADGSQEILAAAFGSPRSDSVTAHVCENFTCKLPTSDLATFVQQLEAAPERQPRLRSAP